MCCTVLHYSICMHCALSVHVHEVNRVWLIVYRSIHPIQWIITLSITWVISCCLHPTSNLCSNPFSLINISTCLDTFGWVDVNIDRYPPWSDIDAYLTLHTYSPSLGVSTPRLDFFSSFPSVRYIQQVQVLSAYPRRAKDGQVWTQLSLSLSSRPIDLMGSRHLIQRTLRAVPTHLGIHPTGGMNFLYDIKRHHPNLLSWFF